MADEEINSGNIRQRIVQRSTGRTGLLCQIQHQVEQIWCHVQSRRSFEKSMLLCKSSLLSNCMHSQKMRHTACKWALPPEPDGCVHHICKFEPPLEWWYVAQVLSPEIMPSMSDGTMKHFRYISYGTWIMSISQSCKAYIKIIKLGGIVQKTSTERHWFSAVEFPRPVQASHIVSHRLTKVRGQFSARLWDVELSNYRFQAGFQRRMKQQFVPGKHW